MLQLAQVLDVRLFDVSHFLDRHLLSVQFTQEDGALSAAAHPLQVRNLLERHLPGLCRLKSKGKDVSKASVDGNADTEKTGKLTVL